MGSTAEVTDCRPFGTRPTGDTCAQPVECTLFNTCVASKCRRVCSLASSCSTGPCQQVTGWLQYGVCPL